MKYPPKDHLNELPKPVRLSDIRHALVTIEKLGGDVDRLPHYWDLTPLYRLLYAEVKRLVIEGGKDARSEAHAQSQHAQEGAAVATHPGER